MWLARVMDTLKNYFEFSVPIDRSIDFLALMYASPDPRSDPEGAREVNLAFADDFATRVWLTYRRGFESLVDKDGCATGITSDAGWGCSIRATQMLIAQSFISLAFGRDWRRSAATPAQLATYRAIIGHFSDSPESPFSIHKMVAIGHSRFGKRPSEWFGPTTGARAVAALINGADTVRVADTPVCAITFDSGEIYAQEVTELLNGKPECSVIVLLTHMLGLDSIDLPKYKPTIQSLFAHPFFQGLSSGESMVSAYYFFAACSEYLYYLDPHTVQPAFIGAADLEAPQPKPLKMRWSRLNPSMTIGFLVRNDREWRSLCDYLTKIDPEVFEISHSPRKIPQPVVVRASGDEADVDIDDNDNDEEDDMVLLD